MHMQKKNNDELLQESFNWDTHWARQSFEFLWEKKSYLKNQRIFLRSEASHFAEVPLAINKIFREHVPKQLDDRKHREKLSLARCRC